MEPVTTRAIVIRETDTHLKFLAEDAPQYAHHTIKDGTIYKSDPINLNKKHILEGSDNLGVPDSKKENDTRVLKGNLVIPGWIARQKGIWIHNPQPTEEKASTNDKK